MEENESSLKRHSHTQIMAINPLSPYCQNGDKRRNAHQSLRLI